MRAALLTFLLLTAAACRPHAAGPVPTLRLGRDVCSHCGMIISDASLASGYVDKNGRSVLFDDLGELFAALKAAPPLQNTSYVHDAVDGAWVKAAGACYVRIQGLQTPMGSGVVAFRDAASSRAWQQRYGKPTAACSSLAEELASPE